MPTRLKIVAGLSIVTGFFLAGYLISRQPASTRSSAVVRQVRYTCPMHPQYRSDKPGDCPSCGMRLVPAPEGQEGNAGMLKVSGAAQQLIGVRTEEVRRQPTSHLLRVPGRVTVDEGRLYRLLAATDGWIRELGDNAAGSLVQKGQTLAAYYTSNLLSSSQTLLYAMSTNERSTEGYLGAQRGPSNLSFQVAVDTLRSLGMSDAQMEEVQRTRQAASLIRIISPATGFVLARNVSPEQRFEKGAELYRIADIGHVWVMADVFEQDNEFLKPGTTAAIRYRDHKISARMGNVLPQFDPASRTLKIRFELDNPNHLLRPDMFVDVEIQVNAPEAIVAPADAVIDSGLRKIVFVEHGNGVYEPRNVETGRRFGDQIQITRGLEPRERIVVSGNFLIDSESRMKMAAASSPAATAGRPAEKDPVCGMEVDPHAPGAIQTRYGGQTYFFCSPKCKKDFEAAPAKYVSAKRGPA